MFLSFALEMAAFFFGLSGDASRVTITLVRGQFDMNHLALLLRYYCTSTSFLAVIRC